MPMSSPEMSGRLQACLAALLAVACASAWYESDALGARAEALEDARALHVLDGGLDPERNQADTTSWDVATSVAEDPTEDDEYRRNGSLGVASYAPRPVSTSLLAEWLRPHSGSLRTSSFIGLPRGPPSRA